MVVFYISYKYNWINVESYCISLLSLKDHTLHICLGQRKRKENQVRLAQSETSDLMRVAILSSSTRSAVPPSARRAAFAGAAAARSLVQEPLSLKPDQAQSLVGFFQQPKDWVLSSPSVGSGLTQVNSSCPLPPTKPRPLPHDWGWQAAPWRIREIARGGPLRGWQLQQLAPPPPCRCGSCVVHPTPTCGQSATHTPPYQLLSQTNPRLAGSVHSSAIFLNSQNLVSGVSKVKGFPYPWACVDQLQSCLMVQWMTQMLCSHHPGQGAATQLQCGAGLARAAPRGPTT